VLKTKEGDFVSMFSGSESFFLAIDFPKVEGFSSKVKARMIASRSDQVAKELKNSREEVF
jgi:hypothetical protein